LVGDVQVGTVGMRAGSTMPVGEIVLTVGFQAQAHFTAVFKGLVGCAPLAVIQGEIRPDDSNRFDAVFAPED
jgi:AraC-like DNA-binding protein